MESRGAARDPRWCGRCSRKSRSSSRPCGGDRGGAEHRFIKKSCFDVCAGRLCAEGGSSVSSPKTQAWPGLFLGLYPVVSSSASAGTKGSLPADRLIALSAWSFRGATDSRVGREACYGYRHRGGFLARERPPWRRPSTMPIRCALLPVACMGGLRACPASVSPFVNPVFEVLSQSRIPHDDL